MKFNILALALAFSFPLITAAACAGCDTESLNAIGQCQTPWVDKVIACQNSPCNVKFAEDPILQCQGNIGDGTLNFTSTKTGYMTSDSSDGTLFPIPTIINDIDPSTSPNGISSCALPITKPIIHWYTHGNIHPHKHHYQHRKQHKYLH
ncbi:hypothetical protein EV426DRAFT_595614 [Tirmania nivea]|nr:hypothetical protein EV426DRAFT_595614 [Tirmania nivea]